MKLIIDARALRLYPVGRPGFHGGTELMVQKLAEGLSRNHTVHVVTPDLAQEEQRGPRQWWWGPQSFPTKADVVVMVHNLEFVEPYSADKLVLATNGIDPWLGPGHSMASGVDAFPVFSEVHADLLCKARPTVDRSKCFVTGLGVDLDDYRANLKKAPGRLLYANDPQRGLWHLLEIFEHVKRARSEATLHIAYDFERTFEQHRWQASAMAELLWECKRRIETTPGVVSLGALTRRAAITEQWDCQIHVMPSDPPNTGSQIHGLTQLECAAAGCALVLSETEAFPEVFGKAATLLPLPGTYRPDLERRIDAQDWAEVVVDLLSDQAKLDEASRKARALAKRNTWNHVIERWEAMLVKLGEKSLVTV